MRTKSWIVVIGGTLFLMLTSCNRDRSVIKRLQDENEMLRERVSQLEMQNARLTDRLKTCNDSASYYRAITDSLAARLQFLTDKLDALADTVMTLQEEVSFWKPHLTDFQQKVAVQILSDKGKTLNRLIAFGSGTQWVCDDMRSIIFLKRNVVMVKFHEKGNPGNAGLIILRVTNPKSPSSWKVIWQALI